jgi:hypothetical protein
MLFGRIIAALGNLHAPAAQRLGRFLDPRDGFLCGFDKTVGLLTKRLADALGHGLRLPRPYAGDVRCLFETGRMIFKYIAQKLGLFGGALGYGRQHVGLAAQRFTDDFDPVGRFVRRVGQARHALLDMPRCLGEISAPSQISDQQPEESRRREDTGEETAKLVRQERAERTPADPRRYIPDAENQP